MAICTREPISPQNEKISITLTGEDYLPLFEKSLKQYSRTANIPGFRKGMVPAGLIKKMHGQALFTEEILRMAEKELSSYLEKEKLSLLAQPLAEPLEEKLDMNHPADYRFDFEIGVRPEFEITPLKEKLKLKSYHIVPTDEELDREINRLQRRLGKINPAETVTDSPWQILKVTLSTKEVLDAPTGEIGQELTLEGEDLLPGTLEKLAGLSPGSDIEVEPGKAFQPSFLERKLPGVDPGQTRLLTIHEIQVIDPAPLETGFFEQIFPGEEIKDAEQFKARVRTVMESQYEKQVTKNLEEEIFEILVHGTPITLPEAFLKKWLQHGQEKPLSAGEAEQKYPEFDHELRWSMISDRLKEENHIEATMDEVRDRAIQDFESMYPGFAYSQRGSELLNKILADRNQLRNTYNRVTTQKLFDWLISQAEIERKEVTPEEFYQLTQNHHAHEHAR